ncbi:MAG: DHA2 family efflux MFS transporter permease subunit [Steroidobacteraceae bacterium]
MSTPVRRGWVTVAVMSATVMQAIDTTIANVALPHMQGALSASFGQIAWVLTSYIVASAICIPLTGFLAARFGRKRVFTVSVIGFTIASMLCGAAQSLTEIVAARLLQGAFGAALVPLSQAVLLDTWPRERHASAMAWWGVGVMLGPVIGPTLGGFLTEYYSWRWVFYINVPIGVLAWIGVTVFVPETPIARERRFDLFGFGLLAVAIGALQLCLDRGETLGWFDSTEIVIEASVAALCCYMFIVHMFTHDEPFLEPAIFRDRSFVAGSAFALVVGLVLLATIALLPPYLQTLLGYPVRDVGVLLAARGCGTMLGMLLVGRIGDRVHPLRLIFPGMLLNGGALYWMSLFSLDTTPAMIFGSGLVQGVGIGLIFVPLSALTFSTLAPQLRNEGTAFYSLTRNIGSSVGVSAVTSLLAQHAQSNHAALVQYASPLNVVTRLPGYPAEWSLQSTGTIAALEHEITRQSLLLAYVQDFRLMLWLCVLATPLLLMFSRRGRTPPAPTGIE